jgi:FAD/FMN-containing dehydrogenase
VDEAVLATHSTDRWFASRAPEVVVFAERTEQVSALLRYCTEHRVPVTPRGAGRVCRRLRARARRGGAFPRPHAADQGDRFGDAVAVVEPGVITGFLQSEVRKRGLFYPPDPASLKECSIGGNIATNAGGPRCLKYGVTRHYVLGLEVVLAAARCCAPAAARIKNKTGFDLISLFVGSEGLLGVVTEATCACCLRRRRARPSQPASTLSRKRETLCRKSFARLSACCARGRGQLHPAIRT